MMARVAQGMGRQAVTQLCSLVPSDFEPSKTDGKTYPRSDVKSMQPFFASAVESLAAYGYATCAKVRDKPLDVLDTTRLSTKTLCVAAEMMTCFQAISTLAPKQRTISFEKVEPAWGGHAAVADIVCKRYTEQPRVNRRQTVTLLLQGGVSVRSKALLSNGRTTRITARGSQSKKLDIEKIQDIELRGRPDVCLVETAAAAFWREVLLRDTPDLSPAASRAQARGRLDPSGLFYPIFRGVTAETLTETEQQVTSLFNLVRGIKRVKLIKTSELDDFQQKAALALAAPIRRPSDRLVLVHGPPGTGKVRQDRFVDRKKSEI